jgi:hypothetical protein
MRRTPMVANHRSRRSDRNERIGSDVPTVILQNPGTGKRGDRIDLAVRRDGED